ncbi:hypothetical protein AZE42_09289 [Rhizopogon vesiculosus]|uniref:REJ domain-containing protein n=1 Tax=Rhizopogon vesiculosus TaxID=180088 RepID=A0A1J8R0P4_9AGAM|nr:hypothetical protein AZE42_09289 [Rhizopogon vesiculosus]
MIRRPSARSASLEVGTSSEEETPSGPTSQPAPLTTGSLSVATGQPSVATGPYDPTTTTSSSSHASSDTQNTYQQTPQAPTSSSPSSVPTSQNTLPSLQTPGQVPSTSISETLSSPFDAPSSFHSDGTSTTYNGSGTSTGEPKLPSPSSLLSMSVGNEGQTKSSLSDSGTSIPSPTGGTGGTPQNSPTISDIGPSLNPPSGVSPSPPSNSKGSVPGLPTSVSSQSPANPSVTSVLSTDLPVQQTPSQSPSPTTSPTSPDSSTPNDSATSTSNSSKPNGPPQTTTSAPTSTTSSSQDVLSLLSSILSPNTTYNPAKSSDTTSSPSIPTDTATSTSSEPNARQTTTSVPTSTSSSQEGFIPSVLSGILSPNKTHSPAKTPATTSISSLPTDSITSTSTSSEPSDLQTTTSAATLTPSPQDGSITSVSSSRLSPDTTHNPDKSPATTSSPFIGDPQTSPVEAPSPSTSSTDHSPPTTQTDNAHTYTVTTLNSPASGPTDSTKSPITTSSTTLTRGSLTTVPGENSHSPQSPSGNPADSPSPTVTLVTGSFRGSTTVLVVQPSNDPTGTPSTAQGTTPTAVSSMGTFGTTTSVAQDNTSIHNGVASPQNTGTPMNLPVEGSTSTPTTTSSGKSLSYTTFTSESTYVSSVVSGSVTSVGTFTSSIVVVQTSVPNSEASSNEDAIIGGVVGGILVLLVLGIAACYFIRRRRRSRDQQQLHYRDLTAPLSPEAIETMRETHPYRPTYNYVGGQGTTEGQDDMHRASGSFISSAFAFPRPTAAPGSSHSHIRNTSDPVFYENVRDGASNDGYASSDDGSEATERYLASAQSVYSSNDLESSMSVGVGIAIGSESSTDLHSYHTAPTTLAPMSLTPVDDDDDLESPGPSPSSFPAPPSSIPTNPFIDVTRTVNYPDFETVRASHRNTVSVSSEAVALAPTRAVEEQQTSWIAAVAAASASSVDAPTTKATQSLNPFTEDRYVVNESSDSSSENTKMTTPSIDSFFIVNPFLRETSQEGFSDDSRSSESHETVPIPYAYSDPFEFRDQGKGKAYLSADLMDNTKGNRLSNASSGLEFPESPSQCGVAL